MTPNPTSIESVLATEATSSSTISFSNETVFQSDDNPKSLIKTESNTELHHEGRTLSHSISITGVADLEEVSGIPQLDDSAQNLCSASLGAKVLFATDEWFATADNLLKDNDPEFDENAYCEQGKVMDGWESRRRREEGHDWCLIQLASPFYTSKPKTKLVGIEVDTAFFTGNHTPSISLEIAFVEDTMSIVKNLPNGVERLLQGGAQGTGYSPDEVQKASQVIQSVSFHELLPRTPLNPGYETSRYHFFQVNAPLQGNLIKLNYYPDGGVARLRLWAIEDETMPETPAPMKRKSQLYMPIETGAICTVVPHGEKDPSSSSMPSEIEYEYPELSAQLNGGTGIACSNKHYGEPWRLVQPNLGLGMWDGWETARHRSRLPILIRNPETGLVDSPLNDWCILKLGKTADEGVARVIVDTKHFFGNFPESVLLEGCNCSDAADLNDANWFPIVDRVRMSPNAEHVFERAKAQLKNATVPVTHVRLSIFPDGGVSRVRVYG